MDFKVKDKAWTRNIHQKFDDVCQEVDDFVSMDTIKYVENQVQTLGDSVMGFCSNILQDLLPALSNQVNHDAETVPQKGKYVTKTYTKSVIDLKEKYADSDKKLLPSALSNSVVHDAELVPQNGKCAIQTYNKSVIKLKEKYADIAAKRISTEQDSVHRVPMPMPTEDDKKLTKSLFPLVKDESALVHNNVKSSVVGYIGSEDEGLVAKEKYPSDDLNSNGINDETSLVFVTESDYHNHEITDEAVSAAVVDSVRACSSVEEISYDSCIDDCHCKSLGNPQSSKVERSFVSCRCQAVETTLNTTPSSLSNDFYFLSEFYTIPRETENFVYDHTDSVSCFSGTPDSSRIDEAVSANRSSAHKHERHCSLSQSEDLMSVVEVGHADKSDIDISDTNIETIDLSKKTKLDESCVIVDNKLLIATSCRPRRHRSYKQIIKDACTSTKRLTKEYELLGILYGDIDMESVHHEKHSITPSISGITFGSKQSPTKDLGDSEWELL